MKAPIIITLCAVMFVACNKKADEVPQSEPPKTDAVISSDERVPEIPQCYEFVQQKDTISLSFTQNGAKVDGQLRFKNYEKDSSSGRVLGAFAGDTLKLTYTFQSEGMESVREVFFLKSGKAMVMGLGDMKEENGKQVFTNPKGLKYDKSIALVKTECD